MRTRLIKACCDKAAKIVDNHCRMISNHIAMPPISTNIPRGALIVIEGADRVGKTTLSSKVAEKLSSNGLSIKQMKFPERSTPTGQLIDRFLKGQVKLDDRTVHLLFSANRWELFEEMKSDITSGTTLIVDRYAYSGVAYSASKDAMMDLEWCKSSDRGLIKADAVLYLTVPDEITKNRPGYGDEIFEKCDFQSKVKKNYERIQDETWITIDGSVEIEQLTALMYNESKKVVDLCRQGLKPMSFLW